MWVVLIRCLDKAGEIVCTKISLSFASFVHEFLDLKEIESLRRAALSNSRAASSRNNKSRVSGISLSGRLGGVAFPVHSLSVLWDWRQGREQVCRLQAGHLYFDGFA